jgi:hypothetical protein
VLAARPDLLLSAQGVIRDAGATDDGKPRLDYALVDYRALQRADAYLGIRAGRVKNPLGFYNDTRDVVFSRPGILLPQSVYNETQGTRSLLFSADGAQLYGGATFGGHALTLTGTVARNRELQDAQKRLLIDLGGAPFALNIDSFWNAQLSDDFGAWRFAYSHTFISFVLDTEPDVAFHGDFDVMLDVFSAAWNGERLSLVAEYALTPQRANVKVGDEASSTRLTPDGGYLQAQYRLDDQWTLLGRYDMSFTNRSDRQGRDYERDTGGVRYDTFGYDLTLGASWRSGVHWGVWGEVHITDGTVTVQALDNPDGYSDRYWSSLLLMAAYRF